MNTYFVLWPNDWCTLLEKYGEKGPLTVIYGGPHLSVPSLKKVEIGDIIYPVRVSKGYLYILGRMEVAQFENANDYLTKEGITTLDNELWDTASSKLLKAYPKLGHKIPRNCVDDVAIGRNGTQIRFDFPLPFDLLPDLKLGPRKGEEKPFSLKNGKVSHTNLQGHFRRLSESSAKLLDNIMKAF